MRVLLINPNTVKSPPVPPIGLEYVAAELMSAGHEIKVADLCFECDRIHTLDAVIQEFQPEMAGISVKNIDNGVYVGNEFYLNEIKDITSFLRSEHGLLVFAGGSGLNADPEGVTDFIGVDLGISGYVSPIINDFIDCLKDNTPPSKICSTGFNQKNRCRRATELIDYKAYYKNGGIAGFETHSGCSSSCIYCLEANTPVKFRNIDDIIAEIRSFYENGFNRFYLCDSEFNEDLDHCLAFCEQLQQSGMSITWSLFFKPANYNQKLFRLMKQTGVNLITLTVDSFKKCPLYWNDIEKIIFSAKNFGIKIYIDFLTGFPYEDIDVQRWCLDFFRRLQPDKVNINTYIRLYKSLTVNKIILKDYALSSNLIGVTADSSLVRPVFYNQLTDKQLSELIDGDKLFQISSVANMVDYMSLQ